MMAFLISMWVTLGLFFNYGSSVKAYWLSYSNAIIKCIIILHNLCTSTFKQKNNPNQTQTRPEADLNQTQIKPLVSIIIYLYLKRYHTVFYTGWQVHLNTPNRNNTMSVQHNLYSIDDTV